MGLLVIAQFWEGAKRVTEAKCWKASAQWMSAVAAFAFDTMGKILSKSCIFFIRKDYAHSSWQLVGTPGWCSRGTITLSLLPDSGRRCSRPSTLGSSSQWHLHHQQKASAHPPEKVTLTWKFCSKRKKSLLCNLRSIKEPMVKATALNSSKIP